MFIEQIVLGIAIATVVIMVIFDKYLNAIEDKELRRNLQGFTDILLFLGICSVVLNISKMLKLF